MNPYEILEVEIDATPEEIKASYRRLSKLNHPDVGGNEEDFKKISIAYATLSDYGARAYYDKHGEMLSDIEMERKGWVQTTFIELCNEWISMFLQNNAKTELPRFIESRTNKMEKEGLKNREQFKNLKLKAESILLSSTISKGEDLFRRTVESAIKSITKNLSEIDDLLTKIDLLDDYIDLYDFENMCEKKHEKKQLHSALKMEIGNYFFNLDPTV